MRCPYAIGKGYYVQDALVWLFFVLVQPVVGKSQVPSVVIMVDPDTSVAICNASVGVV